MPGNSKWTRQTYEMVADVMRSAHNDVLRDTSDDFEYVEYVNSVILLKDIADKLAVHFHLDNPNFDRDRFIEACTLVNKRGPISRRGGSDYR